MRVVELEMDEEEARKYIEKYEPLFDSVIYACYYRILGQSSVPLPIDEVVKFIQAEVQYGKYGGELVEMYPWGFTRPLLSKVFKSYLWRNVRLSSPEAEEPYVADGFWVWGMPERRIGGKVIRGSNTVFTRFKFWECYVIRGPLEKCLVPRYQALGREPPLKALFPRISQKNPLPRITCLREWWSEGGEE